MTGTDTRLARAAGERHGFRPDIEGLRAVAIGLVLVYHAGVHLVPGGFVGVDVFFVISGFLITGLLIREIERTGRVSLRTFYARRAKRLLPATAVVLVVTAVLIRLVLPVTQWRDYGGDIVASALYLVNWRFADRAVDYLAEGVGPSPVLHFWSLAVEEQFYIVWPLLLVAVTLVVRHWSRARVRPTMAVALVLVAVPTFWWSVHLTSTNSSAAFFVTTTRLWELAVGAFVAIGVNRWRRLPGWAATLLGWAGLGAIAASAVVFGAASAWPGAGALLPTLGTAAVIVSGTSGLRGPTRLLAVRPMVAVGGLSYSLYLWHWPLLVIAEAWWGGLGVRGGLLVVAASFVPAWLSMRFVENPIRFSRSVARSPRLALSLGANVTLVGVVAGLVLILAVPTTGSTQAGRESAGARAVAEGEPEQLWQVDEVAWIVPDPVNATRDVPVAHTAGCQASPTNPDVITCSYGVDEAEAGLTVALIGDSKAMQWQPALDLIALEQGWQLLIYTKSDCALSAPYGTEKGAEELSCIEWNEQVLDVLLTESPDVAIVTGRGKHPSDADDRVEGLAALWAEPWQRLRDAGVAVIPLADNSHPGFDVYECVAENRGRLSACSFDPDERLRTSGAPAQHRAAELVGVPVVDLNDVICPGERCPAVIGNVLVYRQGSHLTRTFVESAADVLADRLIPLIDVGSGPD